MTIKIMHIGHGFLPMRTGGSIKNAMNLMKFQAKKGNEVHYFFSGRYYPFSKTMIKNYKKDGIIMHELINSPILPSKCALENKKEVYEFENLFREIIKSNKPDIIHIQEILGLPYSLIDILKEELGIPIVMTLHDYYPLCPTVKLYRIDKTICSENEVGPMCLLCCNNFEGRAYFLLATVAYHLEKFKIPVFNIYNRIFKFIQNIRSDKIKDPKINFPVTPIYNYEKISNLYQDRRDSNILKLKKIDSFISPSTKTKEIYQTFLGEDSQIFIVQNLLNHFNNINFKKTRHYDNSINFGVLNGFSSVEKGSQFLLETIDILKSYSNRYNIYILGEIDKSRELELNKHENVIIKGHYDTKDLDNILDAIDVGIIPSVWEEVYGFVGLEFLSKGIPVIGNNLGGITEYTIDNITGWVNVDSSPKELSNIMINIIKNPEQINELNQRIFNIRNEILRPYEEYEKEVENVYMKVLNR
ncbi:MAG: glycosyltransferase [Methanobacteriaceae archaeon]|jgi:glycosyltransferase involved in cell wall biosynthesis|nr:glycosyltransferase [Methanobacteriaceae archaeon]MDO9626341.1 glycosyltransferase [Methanobacteriaceae archaeon]